MAGLDASIIELDMYPELDFWDCNFGAMGIINWILEFFDVGTTYGTPSDCVWKNYQFDLPILQLGLDTAGVNFGSYSMSNSLTCLSSIL